MKSGLAPRRIQGIGEMMSESEFVGVRSIGFLVAAVLAVSLQRVTPHARLHRSWPDHLQNREAEDVAGSVDLFHHLIGPSVIAPGSIEGDVVLRLRSAQRGDIDEPHAALRPSVLEQLHAPADQP
jgi:hypothetical protein